MLTKEVCQKCINTQKDDPAWGVWDDSKWIDGLVMCPVHGVPDDKNNTVSASDDPPEWCRFKFEHAVGENIAV